MCETSDVLDDCCDALDALAVALQPDDALWRRSPALAADVCRRAKELSVRVGKLRIALLDDPLGVPFFSGWLHWRREDGTGCVLTRGGDLWHKGAGCGWRVVLSPCSREEADAFMRMVGGKWWPIEASC